MRRAKQEDEMGLRLVILDVLGLADNLEYIEEALYSNVFETALIHLIDGARRSVSYKNQKTRLDRAHTILMETG